MIKTREYVNKLIGLPRPPVFEVYKIVREIYEKGKQDQADWAKKRICIKKKLV